VDLSDFCGRLHALDFVTFDSTEGNAEKLRWPSVLPSAPVALLFQE
jgi:hypothetical protein